MIMSESILWWRPFVIIRDESCLFFRLLESEVALEAALRKSRFWDGRADEDFNEWQRKVINMLFENFEGKLTSGKWAKICKVSSDTALNDINELLGRGILVKSDSGGRSTNYELAP